MEIFRPLMITNPNIQWSRIANPAQPSLRKTHTTNPAQRVLIKQSCSSVVSDLQSDTIENEHL